MVAKLEFSIPVFLEIERIVWDFSEADWKLLRKDLDQTNWTWIDTLMPDEATEY